MSNDNDKAEYLPEPEAAVPTGNTSGGWFRAMRTPEAWELNIAAPNAFRLAWVIAYRGQYRDGFNHHNLKLGEALLGDFKAYGMTQQQYRTAKAQLAQWHFATFRATSRGTIGKLIATRLFSIFRLEGNEQNNKQATSKQRAGNERLTTTKNLRTEERKELKTGEAPGNGGREQNRKEPTSAERISFEKELDRIEAKLKDMRNGVAHDAWGPRYTDYDRDVILELKDRRDALKARLGSVA